MYTDNAKTVPEQLTEAFKPDLEFSLKNEEAEKATEVGSLRLV